MSLYNGTTAFFINRILKFDVGFWGLYGVYWSSNAEIG